ncbi:hypothetical protein FKM82_025083 [Ascaphus truei]
MILRSVCGDYTDWIIYCRSLHLCRNTLFFYTDCSSKNPPLEGSWRTFRSGAANSCPQVPPTDQVFRYPCFSTGLA